MKKKILAMILALTMALSTQAGVFAAGGSQGEQWEEFNPGVNIALYFLPKEEETQSYTLGTPYEFTSDTYCSSAKNKQGKRTLEVKALTGSDNKGIQSVEYKEGTVWKNISGFNTSISLTNDVDRAFRIVFVKNGNYSIRQTFASDDGTIRLATKTRYAIVKDGTILITRTAPEVSTAEETTAKENTTSGQGAEQKTKAITKKKFLKTCPVVKVKSVVKKKSSKKIKVTLKKAVKIADGYIVCIYKKKSNAKKNKKVYVKSIVTGNKKSFKVSHNYLKKQKKLYIRVCAYKVIKNKVVVSKKWSVVKKVKVK